METMSQPDLRPDCSRCDALCCVLLAFDASDAFAFDKPACVACRHLADDNACRIHASLTEQGFRGCTLFDCHGAGQRVTGQVFAGRSWRDDPALLPPIEAAFRVMRRLHEAVALLHQAASLPLSPEQQAARLSLLANLDAGRDWTEAALRDLELGPDLKAVPAFFAALRQTVKPPRR
jgi:hypothetical protein